MAVSEGSIRFPRIAALLLAAGLSRRMGGRNKLLVEIDGEPVARRAARALLEAGVGEVFVALGRDAPLVADSLRGLPRTRLAENPRYAEGMGASLAFAAARIDASSVSGALVCLGDLPWLLASDVARVCEAFERAEGLRIVAPVSGGRRGHPVCFPSRLLPELRALRGDVGARSIIEREGAIKVAGISSGCIKDLNTMEDASV